jgi:hypothetical protein
LGLWAASKVIAPSAWLNLYFVEYVNKKYLIFFSPLVSGSLDRLIWFCGQF